MSSFRILEGDVRHRLADIDEASVQTCITSPPYWGLRDYGQDDQLGLEPTPEEYTANLVAVFRDVRRVLRDDGTLWLNLGDSYASDLKGSGGASKKQDSNHGSFYEPIRLRHGLKPKDLVGIPWRVAFALQADGWYLRSDIIWHKPNPMPESVTDRPTKAHEYLFLLTKSPRYYYDADAIREASEPSSIAHGKRYGDVPSVNPISVGIKDRNDVSRMTATHCGVAPGRSHRNKRSVWTVTTKPFSGAHFAVFPPDLIEPCVLAGSSPIACGECGGPYERIVERKVPTDPGRGESKLRDAEGLSARAASTAKRQLGGNYQKQLNANPPKTVGWRATCDHSDDSGRSVVLDPFTGSGTTGMVALRHGRDFVGTELNPEYAQMARDRIRDDAPLLNEEAAS